jgi:hypothetical protein
MTPTEQTVDKVLTRVRFTDVFVKRNGTWLG